MFGLVLIVGPITLLAAFFLWERKSADQPTLELAATPFRRWRRSSAIGTADAVAASRIRVGEFLRRAVIVGWVLTVLLGIWHLFS